MIFFLEIINCVIIDEGMDLQNIKVEDKDFNEQQMNEEITVDDSIDIKHEPLEDVPNFEWSIDISYNGKDCGKVSLNSFILYYLLIFYLKQ